MKIKIKIKRMAHSSPVAGSFTVGTSPLAGPNHKS
jgi:hypothetical protein